MKLRQVYSLVFLALSIFDATYAQQNTETMALVQKQSNPIVYGEQNVLYSNILNEDRIINISLPESFHEVSKQHTYPVLLLLEDEFFQMVSGIVKHLSSVERMPETIVVSLANDPIVPTVFTNGSNFWPGNQLSNGDVTLFTNHLKEELFPYLRKKYRTNGFNMVMGLSFSSIYTLHTFVKEPDLFDAHVAIASGDILGMGYKEGESFIDLIVDNVANSNQKGYLYITSSDADGGGKAPEIQSNLEELENLLSPYRSERFKFISKLYPNEGHYDVALPGFIEALNMIFPKEKWFARYRDIIKEPGHAMKNIDTYFEKLSADYGFEVLPKAERWNSVNRLSWIGPYLSRTGNTTEAIEVIERWVKYRPKSPLARIELAKAYELNNEDKRALSILEKVNEMALNLEGQELNRFKIEINQLKEKIINKGN